MTKEELVRAIAEKAGTTKTVAERCLNAFMETVEEVLKKNGEIRLVGFGTFKVVQRKERKGKNPKTKEDITIPAKKVVKFQPGKRLEI
ncbi:HU family DNA-binding protein [Caldisericum sp.]|uniref:HU family DNA-binding protein n=1 Tax=Caldisericum sp. TaxID=2499687 RepID=UPI003D0F85C9